MRLALRELHRRPGRFLVATTILALLALLLMVLGGLLDGLIAGSTGAYRAQRAQLIVYSADAKESLVRSRVPPALRARVERVAGAGDTAGLGSVQLGARVPGHGPRDLVPVVLFGYELPPKGLDGPPPPDGEVYADSSLQAEGVREGQTILLGPARSPVKILGFLDESKFEGQGTLWGSLSTWRAVQAANRPSERAGRGVEQALIVRVPRGASATGRAAAIDRATAGATKTLTIDQAVQALPGVSQQQTTFNQIIGLTAGIAVVVVALFFALITVERIGLYGVLKAVGASSATLFAGVLAQALAVALIASAIGAAASLAIAAALPAGSIPFQASAGRLLTSAAYLVLAALIGCAFSLRRVLRVDPAAAIGGGGI
jgi:hemin transport system permease protein